LRQFTHSAENAKKKKREKAHSDATEPFEHPMREESGHVAFGANRGQFVIEHPVDRKHEQKK
jgi:hypothetical protein